MVFNREAGFSKWVFVLHPGALPAQNEPRQNQECYANRICNLHLEFAPPGPRRSGGSENMKYFVLSGAQKYGPADIATLQRWIQEGRIAQNTLLQPELGGPPVAASTVLDFGASVNRTTESGGAWGPSNSGSPFQPYPRPGLQPLDAERAKQYFTWSIVCAIVGLGCCPILISSTAIGLGIKARNLGHPYGGLAVSLGTISLILGLIFGAYVATHNNLLR